jgi:hypothetical protein
MALDDEDDKWEEEIKRSLRYEIRLLIKHPEMDPARITEELRLKPNLSHRVGKPRMTPKGGPLPGLYRESAWSHWFRVERNRLFFADVVKLIDRLEPHKNFLHEIVSGGGRISLIIHLPGDTNIGSTFHWQDMARLAALRINLGIEVFPDFN